MRVDVKTPGDKENVAGPNYLKKHSGSCYRSADEQAWNRNVFALLRGTVKVREHA